MKKLLIVLMLLIASTVSAQTFPYYPPNELYPIVRVAMFTNPPTSDIVATLQMGWRDNSNGTSELQIDVFPLTIKPSISGDEKIAYEEMRPLIEAHPGYHVYVFGATFCSCGCSFGYAMDPWYQATAWIATWTASVIGHELVHALGVDHYHRVACPTPSIDTSCAYFDEGGGNISVTGELSLSVKEQFGWVTVPEITGDQPFSAGKIPYRASEYLYVYIRDGNTIIDYVKHRHRWTLEWDWNQVYRYSVLSAGSSKCINMESGSVTIGPEITFSQEPCPVPICEPLPTQTRTISCPKPYKGYMTQERVSTCPGPTWGAWMTIENNCYKKGR